MEIYAICNWRISPFNDDLNNGKLPEDIKDYAFLTIPKDITADLLTTTDIDSYIICSCPIDAIQAIFPLKVIEVKAKDAQSYKMLFSKIVINNLAKVEVVITSEQADGSHVFASSIPVTPGEFASSAGITEWISKTVANLIDVNVTVSRDPPSCKKS